MAACVAAAMVPGTTVETVVDTAIELAKDGTRAAIADIAEAARRLKASGAEGLLLASNTMHKVADEVAEETGLPILHIGDAAADRIAADRRTRVALLGTRFVQTEPFLRQRYESRGIQIVDLNPLWRAEVDRIIYEELAAGRVVREASESSRR